MWVLWMALGCSGSTKDLSDDSASHDSAMVDSAVDDSGSDDSGSDDSGPDDSAADDSADTGPFDRDGDGYPAAEDCDDYDPERWDQVGGPLFDWVAWSNVYQVCDGFCERPVTGAIELEDAPQGALSALDCVTEVGLWVDIDCAGTTVNEVGINALREVPQQLHLTCHGPPTLNGLASLERVGELRLGSSTWADLGGLAALREVDGDLSLFGMDALTSLSALSGLERLGGDLTIQESDQLRSLAGLEGAIAGVGGVTLRGMDQLDDVSVLAGAASLEALVLDELPALEDLAPIPAGELERLSLRELPLTSLADLTDVAPQVLMINELDGLTGLEGVSYAALTELRVDHCDALTSLEALSEVSALDALRVSRDDALTDLDGLDGLRHVQGRLEISHNAQLTDLSALHGLLTAGDQLYIHDNPCLPQSEVDALLEAIGEEATPEAVLLSRNEGPC